jgi:hypothetical protein
MRSRGKNRGQEDGAERIIRYSGRTSFRPQGEILKPDLSGLNAVRDDNKVSKSRGSKESREKLRF